MDLPPEIRDRIYGYAVLPRNPLGARFPAQLKEPAITAVSTQVRQEALPVFYADSPVDIVIVANVCEAFTKRVHGISCPNRNGLGGYGGTFGAPTALKRHIRNCSAVFRCVTFHACVNAAEKNLVHRTLQDHPEMRDAIACSLSILYEEGHVEFDVMYRSRPNTRRLPPHR